MGKGVKVLTNEEVVIINNLRILFGNMFLPNAYLFDEMAFLLSKCAADIIFEALGEYRKNHGGDHPGE